MLSDVMKNMTVKCPEEIQRRFVAYCKLNGLTAQEVLVAFMKEKGEGLAKFEDQHLKKPLKQDSQKTR